MFLYTTHLFILFCFMPMLIPICLHPLFIVLFPAVFSSSCAVCCVLLFSSSCAVYCFKFVHQNSYNRGFSTYNYVFVTYTNLNDLHSIKCSQILNPSFIVRNHRDIDSLYMKLFLFQRKIISPNQTLLGTFN